METTDLEARFRAYESTHDRRIPPGVQVVARLDGRNFSRLTKEIMDYEAPFDIRFRDAMAGTMRHLMECGFTVQFAYAQSDEISLYFDPDARSFGRKQSKWLSILAGEASAALSLAIGKPAVMDCRIIELPDMPMVVDYFRWRMQDAGRNCLNAHAYWVLRKTGMSVAAATGTISGLTNDAKLDLLRDQGIAYDALPAWQRRGYAVMWETFAKPGLNPMTGQTAMASRRRLRVDFEIPHGNAYAAGLQGALDARG